MKLEFELDSQLRDALEELRDDGVAAARRTLVTDLTREVLQATHDTNPVATGRSQSAWGAALSQLGDTGSDAAGNGEGQLELAEDDQVTVISATNSVPYITFLEYGTSKMPPFAMLRSSLAAVLGRISQLFRIEF